MPKDVSTVWATIHRNLSDKAQHIESLDHIPHARHVAFFHSENENEKDSVTSTDTWRYDGKVDHPNPKVEDLEIVFQRCGHGTQHVEVNYEGDTVLEATELVNEEPSMHEMAVEVEDLDEEGSLTANSGTYRVNRYLPGSRYDGDWESMLSTLYKFAVTGPSEEELEEIRNNFGFVE